SNHQTVTVWEPRRHDSEPSPTIFWTCRMKKTMRNGRTTAGETELSIDLAGCLVQVEASRAWFSRRVLPLSVEQLRWRPGPQRWSIAECLDHLNITLGFYLPKIDKSIQVDLRQRST